MMQRASAISPPGLTSALEAWSRLLGAQHVTVAAESLAAASKSTLGGGGRVCAVIAPGDRADVQEVMRIASRFHVPIYPISSGRNWGYGSRAPVRDGVLVDLHRLNRIVDFDEDLAYVTVEPGVTQRQLHEFLNARGSSLWMDATGASPECSIIGNTVERGFGHTPMGDHCAHASAFEVVLPNGDCIDTGFARFGKSKAGALSHWGIGPHLDGLFTQSNFGIVTRMSVQLMPAPEAFKAFFFSCQDDSQLGPVIDALRPLRLQGTLRSVIHIGNDYKVLAGSSQYPWQEMNGQTPLPPERMPAIRRTFGIGSWNGGGGLYGSREQVKAAQKAVRKALKGKVNRLQFVDDRLVELIAKYGKSLKLVTGWDLSRTLKVLRPVYNLMKGVPTDTTLDSTYWRKRMTVPASPDPDRDGCGLLWCSPVFPATGVHAHEVTRLVSQTLLAFGFEPQMSISLETERSAVCISTISYDRDVPGEDERASTCYRVLTEELLARGYPPYRVNIAAMQYSLSDGAYGRLLESLKETFDPQGVLAPGRYCAPPAADADSRKTGTN